MSKITKTTTLVTGFVSYLRPIQPSGLLSHQSFPFSLLPFLLPTDLLSGPHLTHRLTAELVPIAIRCRYAAASSSEEDEAFYQVCNGAGCWSANKTAKGDPYTASKRQPPVVAAHCVLMWLSKTNPACASADPILMHQKLCSERFHPPRHCGVLQAAV